MHDSVNDNWRKSSYSAPDGGQCVEVAASPAGCAARDSKSPTGPLLSFAAPAWSAFLSHLAADRTR
ncbi:DUF397 domain-containing protein [Streptomyces sp. NPDC004959]|uniref:DUF397 domain-containing protein n=1 Tax=unclassified Streptomyces TaxID=2593676 RepID=UPI0004C77132|nr:DUF397 domain-containing protein [Streptomyces sp. NRRL F-5630]